MGSAAPLANYGNIWSNTPVGVHEPEPAPAPSATLSIQQFSPAGVRPRCNVNTDLLMTSVPAPTDSFVGANYAFVTQLTRGNTDVTRPQLRRCFPASRCTNTGSA